MKIVVPLSTQLSWSHIIILLPLKSTEEKLFYAQRAIDDGLGKRDLRALIKKKTFERTKIANTQISKKSKIPLNTFKDPYMLDFLGLQNAYLEKDIEEAILRDLESFIRGEGVSTTPLVSNCWQSRDQPAFPPHRKRGKNPPFCR